MRLAATSTAQPIAFPSTISSGVSALAKSVSHVFSRNSSLKERIEIAGAVASNAQPAAISAERSVAGRLSSKIPAKKATAATAPAIASTIQPVAPANALATSRRATAATRCMDRVIADLQTRSTRKSLRAAHRRVQRHAPQRLMLPAHVRWCRARQDREV